MRPTRRGPGRHLISVTSARLLPRPFPTTYISPRLAVLLSPVTNLLAYSIYERSHLSFLRLSLWTPITT